jgi:acetyl-CoA carboxylase carboxyltransferase component
MGREGAVQLGYRNELAAMDDAEARDARYQELVNKLYEHGKAVNIAPFLSFDDVIDPADTRHWLSRGLMSLPASSSICRATSRTGCSTGSSTWRSPSACRPSLGSVRASCITTRPI